MVRVLCATAFVIAGMAFDQRPLQAHEAPWGAMIQTSDDSVYWDFQYRSFEECLPHLFEGNRGFCNPNPAFQGVEQQPQRHPTRHHNVRQ
jgi:hypothetical protein